MPEPVILLLVRHGSTPTTGKILPGRKPGLHLSKKGVSEVQLTGKYIAEKFPGAIVYSSPMERARETAEIIAKALGRTPRRLDGLNECDFGTWTGKRLSELRKLKAWQEVQNSPGIFRFPKGESFAEMQARIVETLTNLVRRHSTSQNKGRTKSKASSQKTQRKSTKVVVAVSHADPIKVALGYYLKTPLDFFQRLMIAPASISTLVFNETTPIIQNVNMTIDSLKDV